MGVDVEMFFRLKRKLSEKELRRLSWEMSGAIGRDTFYRDEPKGLPIEEREEITQDGPTLTANKGEHFYRINLLCCYYGPDYERGPVLEIIAVAEWLEAHVEGAEVWYGGDSGGICAAPFRAQERAALKRHWLDHGHAPYLLAWNSGIFSKHLPTCPRCQELMINSGGGGDRRFYFCYGCENRVITSPRGQRWLKRGEDFFKVSEEVQAATV